MRRIVVREASHAFAGAVKFDGGELSLYSVECAPEVGCKGV